MWVLILFLVLVLNSAVEGSLIEIERYLFSSERDTPFYYYEPLEYCNSVNNSQNLSLSTFEEFKKNHLILASYDSSSVAQRYVDYHIKVFTTKKRKSFIRWLQRSGKYIDTIKGILREEGLPEELVYLPLIESGFDTSAKSHRRAVGPWQFISATAKRYGLKINYWVDERRDPEKSTRAAAKYLRALYKRFGSWPLALAAYNAGEGKIYKAVRRVKTDDYWKLVKTRYLKRETRNYVARFIAAGLIASNPEKYGLDDVDIHPPLKYEKVVITKPASVSFIAKCSSVSKSVIRELNPELKRWCTPPDVRAYELRIPEGTKEEFLKCFNSASASERMPRVPYVIKKGDTIYEIAKRHGVSVKSVLLLNKGVNPKRLRPGKIIYLPPE